MYFAQFSREFTRRSFFGSKIWFGTPKIKPGELHGPRNRRTCYPSLRFPANHFRTLLCPLRMSATPDPVVSSKRRNCNLFVLQRPRAPQQPPLTQQIKVGANPREPFRTCTCTCTEFRIIYLSIYLCGSLFSRPAKAILQYCIVELRSIFSTSEIIVIPRFFESGFQFRGILDHYPHLGKL